MIVRRIIPLHSRRNTNESRSVSEPPPALVEQLWQNYLAARACAERSNDIADGVAAGKAWGAFFRAFEPAR
jgi:hypothetical protein